jgi:hypothetical protein
MMDHRRFWSITAGAGSQFRDLFDMKDDEVKRLLKYFHLADENTLAAERVQFLVPGFAVAQCGGMRATQIIMCND